MTEEDNEKTAVRMRQTQYVNNDNKHKLKKINIECQQKTLNDMKLHCNYNNILNFTMYFIFYNQIGISGTGFFTQSLI